MMNFITLVFEEFEFNGIKFFEDKTKYPWKTDKEASDLFDSLIKDKDRQRSEKRYMDLMEIQYKESMHVNISRYFLSKIISYILIGVSIILGLNMNLFPGLISLVSSIGFYLLSEYFMRKVREEYIILHTTPGFIKLLFSEEYNNKNDEEK